MALLKALVVEGWRNNFRPSWYQWDTCQKKHKATGVVYDRIPTTIITNLSMSEFVSQSRPRSMIEDEINAHCVVFSKDIRHLSPISI